MHPGIAFPVHTHANSKAKSFWKSPHQELCPDRARVVLTLGRMIFEFGLADNGEGLENRVFICTPNLLNSLVLSTVHEGM